MDATNSKRKRERRRRRESKGVLFYAGTKLDGTPRGWRMQDIIIISLLAVTATLSILWFVNWLMQYDFGFGK